MDICCYLHWVYKSRTLKIRQDIITSTPSSDSFLCGILIFHLNHPNRKRLWNVVVMLAWERLERFKIFKRVFKSR